MGMLRSIVNMLLFFAPVYFNTNKVLARRNTKLVLKGFSPGVLERAAELAALSPESFGAAIRGVPPPALAAAGVPPTAAAARAAATAAARNAARAAADAAPAAALAAAPAALAEAAVADDASQPMDMDYPPDGAGTPEAPYEPGSVLRGAQRVLRAVLGNGSEPPRSRADQLAVLGELLKEPYIEGAAKRAEHKRSFDGVLGKWFQEQADELNVCQRSGCGERAVDMASVIGTTVRVRQVVIIAAASAHVVHVRHGQVCAFRLPSLVCWHTVHLHLN